MNTYLSKYNKRLAYLNPVRYNFYGCIDPKEHKCSHFCRRVPNLPSDLPPNLMTLTPPKCSSFHFPLPNDNEERRNVAL
ncbi:hypothetical protein TNCT_327091 [Trichonephila clavata]|uniref:Uncharacterized protein n=1 Tax=Trichonephila clavata TaxID=2740835 RepID=A0A8X6K5V0_TRICU|nr:hypothetical protein TNCT_327091 [Trichonephila clavata]